MSCNWISYPGCIMDIAGSKLHSQITGRMEETEALGMVF